jgi:hypothetical protein
MTIPIELFQHSWGKVKKDILEMFQYFYEGKLDVSRMNYGVITLLTKIKDAGKIHQYRHICLLNYIYKWVTKVLTIRLEKIADKLILPNNIHEGEEYYGWDNNPA